MAEGGTGEAAFVVGADVFWLTHLCGAVQNVPKQLAAVFAANEQGDELTAAVVDDAKDVVQLAMGIFPAR